MLFSKHTAILWLIGLIYARIIASYPKIFAFVKIANFIGANAIILEFSLKIA